MFDLAGRLDPPPITHPQFYCGLAGLGLVWQFAFFVIATDPVRFRPMMIPSVLEKVSYVGALLVLYLQDRISAVQAATAVPDLLLADCSSRRIALRRVHNRLGPNGRVSRLVNLLAELVLQLVDGLCAGRTQCPAIGLLIGSDLLLDCAEF